MGHHARPPKPAAGYSFVVHPYGGARKDKQQVFVVQPDGTRRGLNESEQLLQARRTPKPRRRLQPRVGGA